VRGRFFYCYAILDVFSRKVVGHAVHDSESDKHAAVLIAAACASEGIEPDQLVVHSDNGHPMRGSTMLATMQSLGVAASFSRPAVSDDNPFIEAAFRTMKYRPEYPSSPFASLAAAAKWVADFVGWYNNTHLHSSIGFVSPGQRHVGGDLAMLKARSTVYEAARRRHPNRWSGACRTWRRPEVVRLNPRTAAADEAAA
jgi:transposase InsO family protein